VIVSSPPSRRASCRKHYADMVRDGRIVLFDRFVDIHEADLVHCALDIVCTFYPRFGHLSSALLHGVAAGRPILANDFGWPRAAMTTARPRGRDACSPFIPRRISPSPGSSGSARC
jgi:hypothetical protein